MSEEKFSKCGEGKKIVSVELRVFGKKEWKLKEKFRGKKIKVFLDENLKWRVLLSSCSLVGVYVNLQVKVTGKKWKSSKYFSGEFWRLKLQFTDKNKVKVTIGSNSDCGCRTWA